MKKKLKNQAILDLRNYSAKALSEIDLIANVAVIILPSDAAADWSEAYGRIAKKNVASSIQLPIGETLHMINGSGFFTDNTVENGVYMVNGDALIDTKEKTVKLFLNGSAIIINDSPCRVLQCNGDMMRVDCERYQYFDNIIELTPDVIAHLERGITIIAGNKIMLDKALTPEQLEEKEVSFAAGNKILCSDAAYGYVVAHSVCGNKIERYE